MRFSYRRIYSFSPNVIIQLTSLSTCICACAYTCDCTCTTIGFKTTSCFKCDASAVIRMMSVGTSGQGSFCPRSRGCLMIATRSCTRQPWRLPGNCYCMYRCRSRERIISAVEVTIAPATVARATVAPAAATTRLLVYPTSIPSLNARAVLMPVKSPSQI